MLSLLALQEHELKRNKVSLKMKVLVGESLIPRARNTIANKFLRESDSDYLLMLDSDLIFEPTLLEKLLDHNVGLVGANYAHKTTPVKMSGIPDDWDVELSKAKFVPTGAMLITREILERINEKLDIPKYNTSDMDDTIGFFNCFVEDKHYHSEDWAFSHRCHKAGVTGYIDNFIRLGHIGTRVYKQ